MQYHCQKCSYKIEGYADIIPVLLNHEKICDSTLDDVNDKDVE